MGKIASEKRGGIGVVSLDRLHEKIRDLSEVTHTPRQKRAADKERGGSDHTIRRSEPVKWLGILMFISEIKSFSRLYSRDGLDFSATEKWRR